MPVELVFRIILEREAAQEVASPDAHQHHCHESRHLQPQITDCTDMVVVRKFTPDRLIKIVQNYCLKNIRLG